MFTLPRGRCSYKTPDPAAVGDSNTVSMVYTSSRLEEHLAYWEAIAIAEKLYVRVPLQLACRGLRLKGNTRKVW